MIKRFGKILLLALSILFLLPKGVLAGEIKSWADYHFESKLKPSGVLLYDSEEPIWKEASDYKVWNLPSGSYKVLSYSPANNTLYGTELVEKKDELGTYSERVLKAYTNAVDLATVLAHEGVSSKDGNGYYTCTDMDAYALFFKDNARSVDDLLFVCKLSDLSKYAADKSADDGGNASSSAKSSISLVSKLSGDGTEARLKLTYNLGTVLVDNEKVVEKAGILYFNNQEFSLADTNGVYEFTVENLTNKVYAYEIESLNGYKYKGSFKADFVSSSSGSGASDDDIASDKAFEKIPNRKPKVKITGIPKKPVLRGIPVTLTLKTDIAGTLVFNGDVITGDSSKKVFKFEVAENGIYPYSVSTGKKTVDSTIEIKFFDNSATVADATDLKLDTTGIGKNVSDIKLAQTGIESNRAVHIIFILTGLGVVTAFIAYITHRKKGVNIDEEN